MLLKKILNFYVICENRVMDYIYFGSCVKLRELSNLYECEIKYDGSVYRSVEHVYQSLKFIESDRKRFEKGGDLSDYECLRVYKSIFYKNDVDIDKKISYWESKKCVGIVAKMCSSKKNVLKLGLTYSGCMKKKQKCVKNLRGYWKRNMRKKNLRRYCETLVKKY
jgi:hypothetical protein